MRVLFYLPVATPSSIEQGIGNLIATAARDAEVHVIVPPPWRGTGLDPAQVDTWSQLPGTTWHLWDGADHPSLRTVPSDPQALLTLVERIAPHYTICRSADVRTPAAFPGKLAFLMEADYPPLPARNRFRLSGPAIFAHGVLPSLTEDRTDWLRQQLQPIRQALLNATADLGARERFLSAAGLPADRPVVALPLEHDGADNFFMLHSPVPLNADCVAKVAAALDPRCVLVLTLHPAQRDDAGIRDQLESIGEGRVRILEATDGGDPTPALARHCDAMVFRDSKSIIWAGLFEKPLCRLTRFASGDWLHAYDTPAELFTALIGGSPRHPDQASALRWLAYHLANDAFGPLDPELSLDDLIDRIERPVDPARWPRSIERERADIAAAAAAIEMTGVC